MTIFPPAPSAGAPEPLLDEIDLDPENSRSDTYVPSTALLQSLVPPALARAVYRTVAANPRNTMSRLIKFPPVAELIDIAKAK